MLIEDHIYVYNLDFIEIEKLKILFSISSKH